LNQEQHTKKHPNIIIMYADDLGFGDVGCYGAVDIETPNIDRIASMGIKFTNAYSVAATCTPARYGLLTGAYPWRNKSAKILPGDAPLIIEPGSLTIMSMLQKAGYVTGVTGKWHLGLGMGNIDWNEEINPGPLELGFNYSFIMAATNDRVPCVYVDGRKVDKLSADDPIKVSYDKDNPIVGVPTGKDNPELLRMKYSSGHDGSIINGVSRIGYMQGGASAIWKDEEMAEVFLNKSVSFITENAGNPFFLYYAFHQPHVPRLPGPRFAGKTKLGPRGDVIAEMDWCVGEILKTLDKLNLTDNTLIIFTSDNGPVLDDGYEDRAVELNNMHTPAGPYRGGKYSMYEGGVHVPFVLSWKGNVEQRESSALVSQVDIFASLASLVGQPLPPDAAPDSFNILDAFIGKDEVGRYELLTEGVTNKVVLHQGKWVYIPPYEGPKINKHCNIELGNSDEPQLYNIEDDISQRLNVAGQYSDVLNSMSKRLNVVLNSEATR